MKKNKTLKLKTNVKAFHTDLQHGTLAIFKKKKIKQIVCPVHYDLFNHLRPVDQNTISVVV